MGILMKVDRRRDKIVDAPTHNCSVLLSIHMDIAWMSTKKKTTIIRRYRSYGISEKLKAGIPSSVRAAMRRYQRTGPMKEKVETSLMVLMQQNGFMIITPE